MKNYGFTLTSASQTMQLNAVGCTCHLTQMSKDLADDISSMAGAQEQHTEIQNNEMLCYSYQKKKNGSLSAFWKKKVGKWGSENFAMLLCNPALWCRVFS